MIYTSNYKSPIGNLLIASKENKLVGLWIENQKYYLSNFKDKIIETENLEILVKTKKWLDRYFKGEKPDISELEINLIGSEFRKSVWEILKNIPYGEVITYNDIAKELAKQKGIKKMSAQAVGGAVGHNPISIIIPCHRVVGSNGSLTGYAGGIKKKIYLLEHEKVNMDKLFVPTNGTAL
ncbi:MAG TPA: methylated-DNA--[protein]-cysteine S-methyltransferase [Candidatus Scatovivens faecipullorum]|nr:methylated-DNA--[protein]-cysteine S-methyltransferase [Candidatus Scatovivens faecipullorum]